VPPISKEQQQHETFRDLWSREGTLARAARRYGALTNDYGFALREMLRGQLSRPIPGLWLTMPREIGEHPGLQEEIFESLADQRDELRNARGRIFTAIAALQRAALNEISRPGVGFREVTIAEARCKDLVLVARLLIEQAAMYEAVNALGSDHPADADACETLFRASERALTEFDGKLEDGMSLQEALAVEILLESLEPRPPGWSHPDHRGTFLP